MKQCRYKSQKSWLRETSLIFTKTPLKFSSISLIAEKKYGNYVFDIIQIKFEFRHTWFTFTGVIALS